VSVKDWGQFEDLFEEGSHDCAVWEAMCPEAVDGTLTEAEQRAFDRHIAECAHCGQEFAEAQRGAAWLHMLKGQTPEPPASLMERILAETTGAAAAVNGPAAEEPAPQPWMAPVVDDIWTRPRQPVRTPAQPTGWMAGLWARTVETFRLDATRATFHPRFAMTAAMAFFSIALSLNLMGVRLRDVKNLSLRPSTLSRTVADAGASAERNFQNLRVVYQFESRVSELRRDTVPDAGFDESAPATTPAPASQENGKHDEPRPTKPHGTSELMPPAGLPKTDAAVVRKEV
jgi:hypothetical protein